MSPNPHQRPLETSTSTGSCALFHCRLRKALSPGLTPGVRRESRQPDARAAIARSTAQQIANPAALTLITALHFGQNFSPPGPSAASGGHCEPITADSNTAESNMELYRYQAVNFAPFKRVLRQSMLEDGLDSVWRTEGQAACAV